MSQRHKQRSVRIANPVPGGRNWTSEARARAYIRAKRAVMLPDGRLKFIAGPGHLAAAAMLVLIRLNESPYEVAARTGLATLEAVRNLPTAGAPEVVMHLRTRARRALVAA